MYSAASTVLLALESDTLEIALKSVLNQDIDELEILLQLTKIANHTQKWYPKNWN
jgi:hypothetical protein